MKLAFQLEATCPFGFLNNGKPVACHSSTKNQIQSINLTSSSSHDPARYKSTPYQSSAIKAVHLPDQHWPWLGALTEDDEAHQPLISIILEFHMVFQWYVDG